MPQIHTHAAKDSFLSFKVTVKLLYSEVITTCCISLHILNFQLIQLRKIFENPSSLTKKKPSSSSIGLEWPSVQCPSQLPVQIGNTSPRKGNMLLKIQFHWDFKINLIFE